MNFYELKIVIKDTTFESEINPKTCTLDQLTTNSLLLRKSYKLKTDYINLFKMDNLIKMVDSVVEDKIDENLLAQFMNKITVWDYNASSKENYLALTQDQKEKIIRDSYSYLLERLRGGKGIHFFV